MLINILIKGLVQQEDITLINSHAPVRLSKYMKQKLTELKGELDSCTTIIRDFITLLTQSIEQSDRM